MIDHEPRAQPAILLVGHGTKDPRGQSEFLELADLLAARLPARTVRACFLELAEPSIGSQIAELAAQSAQPLTVVPLLLFAAGHAKEDIPQAVAQALRPFAPRRVRLSEPLGDHPKVVELSAMRYGQAVASRKPISAEDTALLLVGRGSSDAQTSENLAKIAAARNTTAEVAEIRQAFLAVTPPRFEQAVDELAATPYRRVVIQPHLLFSGKLTQRIADRAAHLQENSDREWVVAPPLGPHSLLVEALQERISSCESEG